MQIIKNEITNELKQRIIPFWNKLEDCENGGFYGGVDFDLNILKKEAKGVILNSRILWFYSKSYIALKDEVLLKKANHGYNFLINNCLDKVNGGVYWSLDYKGQPLDTLKHTYNQSFAIYALSAYYEATKNEDALALAFDLYNLIEGKCRDDEGYLESFTREFMPGENDKLSENGVIAERTMNTLLHVFEGYSGLYEVTKDESVGKSMREILSIFKDKIYNDDMRRQEVFFDIDYNSIIDLHSYGHDIESAWLIEWGCDLLEDAELSKEIKDITTKLVESVYKKAYTEKGFLNECEKGVDDRSRIWWVQAEAVLGFLNEWQKHPEKIEYKEAAISIWKFIKEYVADKRDGGEWYWDLSDDLIPSSRKNIVEEWKCPYHNGRMCLQVMNKF